MLGKGDDVNDQLALFDLGELNALTQKLTFPGWYENLMRHWDKLRVAAAAEFSDERLCAAWLANAFGDREYFEHLPEWEQRAWLWRYRDAQSRIAGYSTLRIPSPQTILAEEEREFQEWDKFNQRMADEIKEAAMTRKPCPYSKHQDPKTFEQIKWNNRVERAFELAGVVIVEAQKEEELKGRRRRRAQVAAT